MDQIKTPDAKYYSQLLNLYDDAGLDPYEYRLIGHYLRRGKCWEGVKKTAEVTRMSVGKVSETRKRLAAGGWIIMSPNAYGGYDIEVIDLMVANVLHYSGKRELDLTKSPNEWGVHDTKGVSPHETPYSPHEGGGSPHETKNTTLRKTKEEDTYTAAPDAHFDMITAGNLRTSAQAMGVQLGSQTYRDICAIQAEVQKAASDGFDPDKSTSAAVRLVVQLEARPGDVAQHFSMDPGSYWKSKGFGRKGGKPYVKNIMNDFRQAQAYKQPVKREPAKAPAEAIFY